MDICRFGLESVVLKCLYIFMAAAMRRRHLPLAALMLHHSATGSLFLGELCVSRDTRHRRSKPGHQQQGNHSEFGRGSHYRSRILKISNPAL
jgi:hypothetical protein